MAVAAVAVSIAWVFARNQAEVAQKEAVTSGRIIEFLLETFAASDPWLDAGTVLQTAERVRRIMDAGHPDQDDVQLIVPWELLEEAKKTALIWNIVLISIAAISLLVGGIGIMNIMLASVTERTREIGIRRALGATRNHIVAQFLVETGSLTGAGGVLGILLGLGVSIGIGQALPWVLNLPIMGGRFADISVVETQITAWSIVVSFLVASAVGLIFGIYPAVVASRQDPIVALRHD